MAELNPLRRRMIEDMKVRNLSPVTQRCYVHAVAKFVQYFNRSPDRLGLADVRTYQFHLMSSGMSWAGFNVAVCALRFFYDVTLGRSAMVDRIPYARKQLPVILSADEVVQFLAAVPNLKHRTALMTAYAAGLRVSEVMRLKILQRAAPTAPPGGRGAHHRRDNRDLSSRQTGRQPLPQPAPASADHCPRAHAQRPPAVSRLDPRAHPP
jgi:site-specific recombinase XerD